VPNSLGSAQEWSLAIPLPLSLMDFNSDGFECAGFGFMCNSTQSRERGDRTAWVMQNLALIGRR